MSVRSWALLLLLFGFLRAPKAQTLDPTVPARALAAIASANQEKIINDDTGVLLRYRVRKVDAKGDTTREIIETKEGTVARLIARDGQPLTAAEDTDERDRLATILRHPDAFLRHGERDRASRGYVTQLLHAMPQAMIWTYAPGQPQPPNQRGPQVVLDFNPDPNFKPGTIVTEALTGIAGRVWVDRNTRCVTRIEGRILHPVDFGWGGVLARVKEGGTIEFEQQQVSDRRWLYSHLDEHLTIREVLIHTVEENTRMTSSDVRLLPGPVSFREAIPTLLAMHVPTR